jgi:glycosyltransferase involved in cell wall biosynthesis
MRILLSIHHVLDPNAGASGVTLKLGEEYQKSGHRVHYFSMDNLPNWLSGKAKGVLFPWFLATYIVRLCREQTIDIVDTSTGDAWVWAKIIRILGQNRPILVTRSHGLEHTVDIGLREEAQLGNLDLSWQYKLYSGTFRLWEVKNSLRLADLALLLNRYDLEYAVQKLGVNSARAHVVPNGIPETFLNLPFEPTPISPNSRISIALVASYTSRKGIHYSVPALNTILSRYPQVRVSFLGTLIPESEVHKDFEERVRNQVQVIQHFPHKQLPTLLKGHQIKLFPSLSEGFSLALPEAMACGLAPIASMIPGAVEILKNEHDSILVPPRDSRAIEQALERLITDRQLLDRLRQNAYTNAQQFSWKRVAKLQLSLYEKTLQKRENEFSKN